HTAWFAIFRAMGLGLAICVMFALMPLLAVPRVLPLAAVRASVGTDRPHRDPLRWLAGAVLAGGGAAVCFFADPRVAHWARVRGRDWCGVHGAGRHRGGADVRRATIRPARAAVCRAAGRGQFASTEQPHAAAPAFARPRDVFDGESLSRATKLAHEPD